MKELTATLVTKELKRLLMDMHCDRKEFNEDKNRHATMLHAIQPYRDFQLLAAAAGIDDPDHKICIPLEMGFELGLRVGMMLGITKK